MHETCLCCDTKLEEMGEETVTADGDHVVRRFKCPGCKRGGSRYRTLTGEIAGSIGPVFRRDYQLDERREPTVSVDHARVATDGGAQR